MGLFEKASDCIGHHVGLLCLWHQAGAVKDCNDGNEGNCDGKGKLRVLGAFGDSSKSVGSRDGNNGFGCLFRVQFELDFYFRASVGRRGTNQLRLLEPYLDVLVKHTTEIPPPTALVEVRPQLP
jgi:hypothetical protein